MSKKHKQHHDEHIDESWLIPYADLLTLLLALFIILFASSQVDSKKYEQIMRSLNSAFSGGVSFFEESTVVPVVTAPSSETKKKDEDAKSEQQELQGSPEQQEQIKKETAELQELKQKLDQYIADNNLSTQLETKLTNDMLMITIRDNALFASGSATVKPDAQKLAVTIGDMLTQYPQYQIEVAGYTDNIPIKNAEFETNWDLSAKRALNFMKILLQNGSIGPDRFRAIGYGEYRPIDTNDTADGRSKNRRVEVSILRTVKEPTTIGATGN
ncbi:flagellar motor protein MotB [Paenibacillus flagellatus]|uniref:Flagellar motor protein MotB n=1 Tax=Paenibacillus flagellatus TaxID=2211139 RepID=A0A2V5JUE6_9BACL|nr:flagellar motor protein MotB [Paenibacillus flagellatus]PYI49971.1 flagellar motor protein MotB [Paenibacillus flagellatus]